MLDLFFDPAEVVAGTVEGVIRGVKKSVKDAKDNSGQVDESKKNQPEVKNKNSRIKKKQKCIYCSKCGAKLEKGVKFCSSCGNSLTPKVLGSVKSDSQTPPPINKNNDVTKRNNEFAGKIVKCPNCGEIIDQTKAVCPSCGMNISGRGTLSSVQQFNLQLKEIQDAKNNQNVVNLFLNPLDKTDAIVELIKNFPVPNTIEDIVEFMILATSSINVKASKKRAFGYSGSLHDKKISDAWVDKMKQLYMKAEISFCEHKAFKQVKKMYEDKMTDLKMI